MPPPQNTGRIDNHLLEMLVWGGGVYFFIIKFHTKHEIIKLMLQCRSLLVAAFTGQQVQTTQYNSPITV